MRSLIFDLETTSPDRYRAGIVEMAAAWFSDHEDPLHDAWSMQCLPYEGAPVDPKAIEVNGCDWLNSPGFATEAEALNQFAQWIERTRVGTGRILVIGWNVAVFDWLILHRAWKQHVAAPWPFSYRTIDLHAVAVADMLRRFHEVPDEGLTSEACCEFYGLEPEAKPHRAMGGVAFEYGLAKILLAD